MDLILKTLRAISYAIVDPTLALILIIIGVMFYIKNRKIAFMQRLVMGETIESPLELTLSQLVIGILGGVLASIIVSFLGVDFYESSGVEFLFIISALLVLNKSKIFIFPYSAAILGLISIVLSFFIKNGEPFIKVNITYLVILVGVISFVQGILIILDGRRGFIPVFTNRGDKILGGFAFNRYWTFPIVILIVTSSVGRNLETPLWWNFTIPKSILSLIATTIFTMLPLYGVVGYNGVTFTRKKKEKTLISGLAMSLYGILLCIIAPLSSLGVIMELIILLLMPLLYEGIKLYEKKREIKGKPLFVSDDEGICILDVIPGSIAFKQGVRSGDKIIEINGEVPNNEIEVFKVLRNSYLAKTIKIKNLHGEIKEHIIKSNNIAKRFGVILVPKQPRSKETVQSIISKIKNE